MKPAHLLPGTMLLIGGLFHPLGAQEVPGTLWTRTYGGISSDRGFSVQQTADGGFVLAGYTSSFGVGGDDVWLIHTDAKGDTLWTRTFGGSNTDVGRSVQQAADGDFVLAGHTNSFGAGSRTVYLIHTDATGETLWTRTYSGINYSEGGTVRQTADGGFVVGGYTGSFTGYSDAYLIRIDANGDSLWTRTFGGSGTDRGNSVQQTSDGGFVLAGWTISFGAGASDVWLIRTDPQGNILWTRTFGGWNTDVGRSVQQTTDGGFVLAGYTFSYGAGAADVWLIRTDAQGDTLWTRTYGGSSYDWGNSVQQTADGGFMVAGYTSSFGAGGDDVWLIKTDAQGNTLWTRTYGGPMDDASYSVQQTGDGGFVVAGYTSSFGAGGEDVWLIRVPVYHPPVAAGDDANTPEDTPIRITVLTNDSDVAGNPLSVLSVTQGSNGSVVIDAGDTTVTYAPSANFFGPDNFEYVVYNGVLSDNASVAVTVTPVNDPPVAMDDAVFTSQNSAVTIFILANDFDVDGDTLTISGTTQGSHGSVAIADGDTTITYTPNQGYNGFDSFTYQVSDDAGGLDAATVQVTVGTLAPHISSVRDVPDDQGRRVYVSWNRSYIDLTGEITQYGLKLQNPESQWVSIGIVAAEQAETYTYLADTFGDSSAYGTVWSRFKVTAHTSSPAIYYTSPVDSGYSIDNIAPTVPTGLVATVMEGLAVSLAWNGPVDFDFGFFRVYRQATADTAATALAETPEPTFADTTAEVGKSYDYWVTALDVNGNESGSSQPVSLTVLRTEGSPDLPTEFALEQNYPNPFNPATTLRFDLPAAAAVRLTIYDLLGQELARLLDQRVEPGYHQVTWNGRDIAWSPHPRTGAARQSVTVGPLTAVGQRVGQSGGG